MKTGKMRKDRHRKSNFREADILEVNEQKISVNLDSG